MRMGSGKAQALLVPDTAVQTDQASKTVSVVGPDNVVASRTVRLGPVVDGLRVIARGLKPGDRVVIGGCHRRAPAGTRVNPAPGRIAIRAEAATEVAEAAPGRGRSHARRPTEPQGQGERPCASHGFFIDRPIFAGVLALVIAIVGAIAYMALPVSQYPNIVPPTVTVTATYPGANAQTVAETVAAPIEQAINGVDDMLYQSSQSTGDGKLTITVTFKVGTDPDKAQVLVQNRVSTALPRLPEEVQRLGIETNKISPSILMAVNINSDDGSRDLAYIQNYARTQVLDPLSPHRRHRQRRPDGRRAGLFDPRLDRPRPRGGAGPDRRRDRRRRCGRRTCRSRPASWGSAPAGAGRRLSGERPRAGPAHHARAVRGHRDPHGRRGPAGEGVGCRPRGAGQRQITTPSPISTASRPLILNILAAAGIERGAPPRQRVHAGMKELSKGFPKGIGYKRRL